MHGLEAGAVGVAAENRIGGKTDKAGRCCCEKTDEAELSRDYVASGDIVQRRKVEPSRDKLKSNGSVLEPLRMVTP